MTTTPCPPMAVRRITEGDFSSHIEPPLDPSWSPLEKLRWRAGVLLADEGVRVDVRPMEDGRLVGFSWRLPGGSASTSGFTYHAAWTYLNGASTGAELATAKARAELGLDQ